MMNREIQITIIACAIVFAGISALAVETMNSDQVIKPQIKRPSETMTPESITTPEVDKIQEIIDIYSIESLAKSPKTIQKKIDDKTSIQKTITSLSIPDDNKFPWGTIQGKINNPAPGHPVIIQFFKSLDEAPVHVAQIDMNDDGTFEYKFRLFSIDDGITTNIFEGEYYVEIFKTVNNQ